VDVGSSHLGNVGGTPRFHGKPECLDRHRLARHNHLDPSDVTVRIIVVDVLGFLDGVEEPDGPYANAFVAIHDDADLSLGIEDTDPVEQLVIVPCGTSGPLLLQQLGR